MYVAAAVLLQFCSFVDSRLVPLHRHDAPPLRRRSQARPPPDVFPRFTRKAMPFEAAFQDVLRGLEHEDWNVRFKSLEKLQSMVVESKDDVSVWTRDNLVSLHKPFIALLKDLRSSIVREVRECGEVLGAHFPCVRAHNSVAAAAAAAAAACTHARTHTLAHWRLTSVHLASETTREQRRSRLHTHKHTHTHTHTHTHKHKHKHTHSHTHTHTAHVVARPCNTCRHVTTTAQQAGKALAAFAQTLGNSYSLLGRNLLETQLGAIGAGNKVIADYIDESLQIIFQNAHIQGAIQVNRGRLRPAAQQQHNTSVSVATLNSKLLPLCLQNLRSPA
jgi:hypothetical protein